MFVEAEAREGGFEEEAMNDSVSIVVDVRCRSAGNLKQLGTFLKHRREWLRLA